MLALLISTYELGRQPFGLASPAAWVREAGAEVACLDLSREELREEAVREAELVAFYVPMHTATRLAIECLPAVRNINPRAHICFYGLYAPLNEAHLRELGVETILGGEFEEGLKALVLRLADGCGPRRNGEKARGEALPLISLARQQFRVPQRTGLPPLRKYAHLILPNGDHRVAGYTEASRGCKHRCRHCPIVPVYDGVFRIVQREVVLADIRQQVAAGAKHITFGDPDFFNGIGHSLAVIGALHREFPQLSYDVTIKIEHLRKHAGQIGTLRSTGCAFVISAVEAVDDFILDKLDKGHSCADFFAVLEQMNNEGLPLQPTFVPFTPWTTAPGYLELLQMLAREGLVECVAPIQLAIRLLITAGSRLLEVEDIRNVIEPFNARELVYPWRHPETFMDALAGRVEGIVRQSEKLKFSRRQTFQLIWAAAAEAVAMREAGRPLRALPPLVSRAAVPYLNEPWYC